jgi:hypothetical protein
MADKRGGLTPGATGLLNQGENYFGTSFNVSSGHRDAAYNATLPGAAKSSDHLTGDAFDISTKGMSGNQAAEVSNYYRGLPNTYVKDDYGDGHIHVSYRGEDNQMGHVNKGAKDTPDPGAYNGGEAGKNNAANKDSATPADGTAKGDGSTSANGQANKQGQGTQTPQQKQQQTSTSQSSCNPKVTGTGKPIGGGSTNSKSGQSGSNQNGQGGKNGQSGTNADGSKKQGADAGNNNKLENTGQTKNLKYNQEQADKVYDGLRDRGYTHEQAVGVMGHWYNESKFNTNITGDNGTSYGIAQWHNERWDGLNNYASQTGRSPSDLNTQLDYFDKEMRSNESAAGNLLRNSTTVEGASAAMNRYERFAGWNTGGSQVYDRLANANTFNGAYAGRR